MTMSDATETTSGPTETAPAPEAAAGNEVDTLKAKADENWNRYVRLAAEFDNFKKRAVREREDATRYANQALLTRLLPVIDNFEMALTAATGASGDAADPLRTGVNMILSQLKGVLTEAGVEEIEATGQPFNPSLHEAVSQRETADAPEGQVVLQLRRGYKLRDRLLRPAAVIVARPPAAASTPTA
jgi:molecular chaperone GrpE